MRRRRGGIEQGGDLNVSFHVGKTRFGGDVRGAVPEALEGVGDGGRVASTFAVSFLIESPNFEREFDTTDRMSPEVSSAVVSSGNLFSLVAGLLLLTLVSKVPSSATETVAPAES